MNLFEAIKLTDAEFIAVIDHDEDDFDYQLTCESAIVGPHVVELERDQDDGYRVTYMRRDVASPFVSLCSMIANNDGMLHRDNGALVVLCTQTTNYTNAWAEFVNLGTALRRAAHFARA